MTDLHHCKPSGAKNGKGGLTLGLIVLYQSTDVNPSVFLHNLVIIKSLFFYMVAAA